MKIKDSNKFPIPGEFQKFKIVVETEQEAALFRELLGATSGVIEKAFGVSDIYSKLYFPISTRINDGHIYPTFKDLALE
jgi:hypothetical protein